jgi:exodeoxyribonuclease VII large subunit
MTERFSLSELQLIIRDSLYLALPDMYWVIAEISEINENYSGHCYLELIEKQPDDQNVKAKAKAIIWSKRYRFLKSFFENITGESLREGLKILVKIKVEYHELYGLSLIITDIDPAFTIGDMAMKRQMVIQRLEEEGVFTMNKEIHFPIAPKRIAIISSKNAAGYSDFIKQLTENSYGYIFHTVLLEAAMQGTETEQGIISALDKIAIDYHLFDLVVIIRGGGSQSDLSWFDSYNIAYHVTQFPIPVVTGIGHDKDISVTDMVAYNSLKTPTAVADFLIECVSDAENGLIQIGSEISNLSHIIIEKYKNQIEESKIKLIPAARINLQDIKHLLTSKIVEIISIGKSYVVAADKLPSKQESRLISLTQTLIKGEESSIEKSRLNLNKFTFNYLKTSRITLERFENYLKIMNPINVLRRGYTITYYKGEVLKRCDHLSHDDLIDTHFSEGVLRSKVSKSTMCKTKDNK